MSDAASREAHAFFAKLAPSTMRFGLERIRSALAAVGAPQLRYPLLHVAGTNGKGSTCSFAASCLRAQGYRVGLYTSPHLVRVNERFAVNGEPISDASLGLRVQQLFEAYPPARFDAGLTYFEFGTLLALWHFAREAVDVAVLETGLGGRLDATAAVSPTVTAVTSVSLDHTELLGSTLAAVAAEKAGIFKLAVPVVVSRQRPEALEALSDAAARTGAPLFVQGRDFVLEREGSSALRFRGARWLIQGLALSLRGEHQVDNAAVALAGLEQLASRTSLVVAPEAVRLGLSAARWPGRLEEHPGKPTLLLDGAHNPGAAVALAEAVREHYRDRTLRLVFGVLRDKERSGILRAIFPMAASAHLCPLPTPRSLEPRTYLADAKAHCARVSCHASVDEAVRAAVADASPDDVVLCAGSLLLVGEVKRLLEAPGFLGAVRQGH